MSTWTTEVSPPESLVKQAESLDYKERSKAAEDLVHFVHLDTIGILTRLVDDPHHWVRSYAVHSLTSLIAFPQFQEIKRSVGRAIANHLSTDYLLSQDYKWKGKEDRCTAVRALRGFLDDQLILEALIKTFEYELDNLDLRDTPYSFCEVLSTLLCAAEQDHEYILQKLFLKGFVYPSSDPAVIIEGFSFLYNVNPLLSLTHARLHLQEAVDGGYPFKSYGRGINLASKNRLRVRKYAAKIVCKFIKQSIDFSQITCKTELIRAILSLAKLAQPQKTTDWISKSWEKEREIASSTLFDILIENKFILSEEFLGHKVFMTLPQEIRDRIAKQPHSP